VASATKSLHPMFALSTEEQKNPNNPSRRPPHILSGFERLNSFPPSPVRRGVSLWGALCAAFFSVISMPPFPSAEARSAPSFARSPSDRQLNVLLCIVTLGTTCF
jgi:hypothetical protein